MKTRAQSDRRIDYVPLDKVAGAIRNPKSHDIGGIRASIGRFGFVAPSVIDERTGKLVAGHGRTEALRAMREAGETAPAGITVDSDGTWLVPLLTGWASRSDAEAEAYLIADNEWTSRGGWDNDQLSELLSELADGDPELFGVTGFTDTDLETLLASTSSHDDDESGDGGGEGVSGSDGSLLVIADVSVAEPTHQVSTGDVYLLGGKHYLVCVDVMAGWSAWRDLLSDADRLFVPYPGPYAALSLRADEYTLVMVQPDHYVAGHILDKYAAIRGDESVTKVEA